MSKEQLRYDRMVEGALRGVVRQALEYAARHGLPGSHHFYVTFRTAGVGVAVPDYLQMKYPDEMTIVLEHQFWDLDVSEEGFSVTLSFQNKPERLVVPFAAITAFADPSVKFGLQFQENATETTAPVPERDAPQLKLADLPAPGAAAPAKVADGSAPADTDRKSGEVVALDQFRKK